MSRSLFGHWGLTLDDVGFAQALAALGVLDAVSDTAPIRGTPAELAQRITQRLYQSLPQGEPVPFQLGNNVNWQMRWKTGDGVAPLPAEAYRDAWLQVFPTGSPYFRPRFEVTSAPYSNVQQLDPLWVASVLADPSVSRGVYFREDGIDVPVAWDWPLRIGLLSDPRSRAIAEMHERSRRSRLFRIVDVGRVRADCDMLLLPYNLRSSVSLLLAQEERVNADCVVVLGGAKLSSSRALDLLRTLRSEAGSASVALASVPKARRETWLDRLIVQLSHNEPFDRALQVAAQEVGSRPPYLNASRRFVDAARLSSFVTRFGSRLVLTAQAGSFVSLPVSTADQLQLSAFESLQSSGERLVANASNYDYQYESGDATSIVDFRERAEAALGQPVTVAQADGNAAQVSDLGPDTRSVQAQFVDPDSQQVATTVLGDAVYTVEVMIALPDPVVGRIVSSQPFPRLPETPEGHQLTLVFCELADGGRAPKSPPQDAVIHLPSAGSSTTARFAVQTAPAGRFVARVVVLHRMRVLQTLLLTVPLNSSLSAATLEDETLVRRGYSDLENRRTFDAALVLNHNEADRPSVLAKTATTHSFGQPQGLPGHTAEIRKILSSLTKLPPDQEPRLDSPELLPVLHGLAYNGRLAWDAVAMTAPEDLAGATWIQVVEAVAGSYLPIELFYDAPAPLPGAKLCPHAAPALAGTTSGPCPNRDNSHFICPTGFWGFSRVIERRPHTRIDGGADFRVDGFFSEPTLKRDHLEILGHALVGKSKKVASKHVKGENGFLAALRDATGVEPHVAKNWLDWPKIIEQASPSLIVLMPHSLNVPKSSIYAALEIGAKNLLSGNLEQPYIRKPEKDPGPAVLLLGCSTELAPIEFHNFVSRFKFKGAALVLGTLGSIRGRHAARFVSRFAVALKSEVGKPNATFGNVLLGVKRHMLAEGDPFVLTLLAYGDAQWRL